MSITELIGEATEYDKKKALEVKKPKSWCKSVSAFANGIGGALIFGISNEDEVVGLIDAEHDAETISEQIKERLNPIPNFNLRFHKTEDGKKLIILDVYAGDQTPYYYEADGSLMAYYRLGNQSVPATPAKLKELVLKGSVASYDSLKSKYSFDNMAFTKLKSTYKMRTGIQFEDSDYESFGIIDEEKNLTNAGALLADESPIRYSRLFCTRWNGLDKAPGIVDAIDDKEYSGGLINLLQDGTDFVINNSKKAWKKTTDGRIEMPDYPERAVLEGLVNALIHRNYLEVGSEVHIDMFDNRIEIYSPGGMYDGTKVQERDLMQIPSRRRNPIIADIFNRLKYMDRRGSGFKKILGDYKIQPQYHESMQPKFNSDNDSFLLVLKNLNYDKSKETKSGDKKAAIKGGDKKAAIKSGDKKVTKKTQQQYDFILEFMNYGKEYGIQDFCDLLKLKKSRTKVILKGLIDENKIEIFGANKDRKYKLR
ncbi:ATP-binding protein [Clostridium hydrogenum]|uniref:ATP-binding protein n=1 Tax=Clostridium hydrogenum TaxID=2855764 RepID=UPI001F328944|nr:ATP-binding protein [Clostridium hydrogenum]